MNKEIVELKKEIIRLNEKVLWNMFDLSEESHIQQQKELIEDLKCELEALKNTNSELHVIEVDVKTEREEFWKGEYYEYKITFECCEGDVYEDIHDQINKKLFDTITDIHEIILIGEDE